MAYTEYLDAIEDTVEINMVVDTFKNEKIEVRYEVTLEDYKPLSHMSSDLAHRIIIRTEREDDDGKRRLDIFQYNGFTEEVNWSMDNLDVFTGFQLRAYNTLLVEGQLFYKSGDRDTSFHIFPTSPETIFILNAKLF